MPMEVATIHRRFQLRHGSRNVTPQGLRTHLPRPGLHLRIASCVCMGTGWAEHILSLRRTADATCKQVDQGLSQHAPPGFRVRVGWRPPRRSQPGRRGGRGTAPRGGCVT